MLIPGWDGVESVVVFEPGCEECRVSRGARKVVEVVPESEVEEMRGKLEVEEEVARPVAVPYPPSLILEDLELVLETREASTRVSSVSFSSRTRSLSRLELDLDIEGTSGYSINVAAAVAAVPGQDE
jgi:hypothetical protein